MGLIIIDENKCKKDGACIKECPFSLIQFRGSYPDMVIGGERACISCGHCVAVCPHSALSHKRVPLDDCLTIKDELAVSREQTLQFLRSRRSIRCFKEIPVEKEKIKELIEVASYAPTAGNLQLLEWQILINKDKIKELAGIAIEWVRYELEKGFGGSGPSFLPHVLAGWEAGNDTILWNAPVLVVVSAPQKTRFGMVDLSLALSYLELAAPSFGLGTCWAGMLQHALLSWPPAREYLGIPRERPHFYSMMLGYRKSRYYRLPSRKIPNIKWR